jgi:hypothetical protein
LWELLTLSRAVTTVESAADALALLKEDPKSYDLVLTGTRLFAL